MASLVAVVSETTRFADFYFDGIFAGAPHRASVAERHVGARHDKTVTFDAQKVAVQKTLALVFGQFLRPVDYRFS